MSINHEELDFTNLNNYLIGDSSNIKNYFSGCDPFVDLTVTSPPYWDAKQYGDVGQIGFGQSYTVYMESLKNTFQGVYNISKPSASLYVIIDTIKRDGRVIRLQDDISELLDSIGWIHQDTIIWDKGKTLPWSSKGKMRNIFEYILFFTKTSDYTYNIDNIKTVEQLQEWWLDYPERYSPDGKVPDNIWRFPIPTQGSWGSKEDYEEEFRHACPFPPEMMARIVKLSSDKDDVVFDPFAGTGVLLATSELLGRRFLGFDTNTHYSTIFNKVTRPLVAKQWEEIQTYYELQAHLKSKMKESIHKLRMLKYPKALLMRLRRDDLFKGDNPLNWDFSYILAISLDVDSEEIALTKKRGTTIGVMKYFILFKGNNEDRNKIQSRINELISKAPFTKYGLITEVELINLDAFPHKFTLYNLDQYFLYTNGKTRNYAEELRIPEALALINNPESFLPTDKDIPPIISNQGILEEDYSMIPANKYIKKTLLTSLLMQR